LLLGLEKSNETLRKRVCELVQTNKAYKAQVVSCSGRGNYSIEFPHVTEVLKKEMPHAGESDSLELPTAPSLLSSCFLFPPLLFESSFTCAYWVVQKMMLFKNTGNKKFWKELICKLSLHFFYNAVIISNQFKTY
jgi:hypothetical protein